LSNHLGNVLVTVSDKKLAVDSDGNGTVDYYNADVVTANDYYPGGMTMPGRKYQASPTSTYRYSINGQEKESELNENITSAEYWEYDSRIVRRWNIDPVMKEWESPYSCFSNNPILMVDPDGDSDSTTHRITDNKGNAITKPTVIDMAASQAKGIPGMKVVGDNRVEVTPGTYAVDYLPNNASKINDFNQIPGDVAGGNKYTWSPGSKSSPVAARPTIEFNTQIIGVTPVNGIVGVLNANLGNLPWVTTGAGNTFINNRTATAAIGAYARQLRGAGITMTNITVSTILASASTFDPVWGNGAGVVRARATTVRGILGGFGIRVGTVNPLYGRNPPVLTAQTNANQVGITGWNVTTQAMQRQTINGVVVPGSTQPVSGSPPATNFQRNRGRAAPGVGGYTGTWQ
jgi:hypothetical protein